MKRVFAVLVILSTLLVPAQAQEYDSITLIREWGGWIVGLASIFVMVILAYLYSRRVVKVSCIIGRPISLISVREEIKPKIEIYYKGRLVDELTLLTITIKNDGNTPIRKENIISPIEFKFKTDTVVVDYSVVSTNPEGIQVELESTENSIKCYIDLLNPEDEVTLQFVCLGKVDKPKVSARIEGMKTIRLLTEQELIYTSTANFSIFLGIFMLLLLPIVVFLFSLLLKPVLEAFYDLFNVVKVLFLLKNINVTDINKTIINKSTISGTTNTYTTDITLLFIAYILFAPIGVFFLVDGILSKFKPELSIKMNYYYNKNLGKIILIYILYFVIMSFLISLRTFSI